MTGKRDTVNEFAERYATSASAPSTELRRQYEEEGFILLSGLIDDETSRAAAALLGELPGMDGDAEAIEAPHLFNEERGLVEHYALREQVLLDCFGCAFTEMTRMLSDGTDLHAPRAAQTQNLILQERAWHPPGPHIDGIPKVNRHRTFPGPYEIAFIAYLSDVEPRGGGTVGWPRSHRAVRALAESDRDRYAYLYDLNRAIGQLDLEPPVELLPKRGDILFFQHLWVHGAPFNTRPQPRLALRPLCDCAACNGRWYKRDGWSFWQP